MKILRKMLVVMFSLLLLMSFIGCSEEDVITKYSVTFDDQSATTAVDPISLSVVDGETAVTLPPAPEKTDYAFGGWFTEVSGGGTEFTTSTVVTADISVYAKWTAVSTVTYDGNGNTAGVVPVDSSSYTNTQELTVLGNAGSLVKSEDGISLNFIGWTNSSGTSYTNGDTFVIGSVNVTLFAKWSALRSIGPAGGLVFHDKGSYSGSPAWRYLEAAPVSTEWDWPEWGSYGILIYQTALFIGSGQANTTAIVNWLDNNVDDNYGDVTDKAYRAAYLCDALVEGGKSDWFLPSKDELNKMYLNLHSGTDENSVVYSPVGGFYSWADYWSSSEYDTKYFVWVQFFYDGSQGSYSKLNSGQVCAARSF